MIALNKMQNAMLRRLKLLKMRKKLALNLLFIFSMIFVNAQEWQTDFEQSKTIAAQENRNIVLVFQGSDWCAPCIKLEKEIWSTEEFKAFAKNNFVMLKADFPRKKKNTLTSEQQEKNNKLAEAFNKKGFFPFVVVLDKDGHVLGETGYKKMSPEKYIKLLTSFKS
jgi:thioredoxin-related protein